MTTRELFETNLALIDRLLVAVCRRNAFPPDDSEEFGSWARLRLIDNDYAILGKWRGESSLPTYLTAVIVNLFRDYRIQLWGKWRPSAEARRLGPTAVLLEKLMAHEGRSFPEAVAVLRSRSALVAQGPDLEEIAARLPARVRRRFAGDEVLAELPAADRTEDRLANRERSVMAAQAERGIHTALARLDAEERLALKLRFADGMAVVDIASLLGMPARPLYRRLERALGVLRRELESAGLGAADMRELLGWSGLDLRVDFGAPSGEAPARPSVGNGGL